MTLYHYSLRITDPNASILLSMELTLSQPVLSRRTDFMLEKDCRLELVPHAGQTHAAWITTNDPGPDDAGA